MRRIRLPSYRWASVFLPNSSSGGRMKQTAADTEPVTCHDGEGEVRIRTGRHGDGRPLRDYLWLLAAIRLGYKIVAERPPNHQFRGMITTPRHSPLGAFTVLGAQLAELSHP